MLSELLQKNRSYRGFDEKRKITKDELLELVFDARFCPAAANLQPYKYKLTYERNKVEQLLKLTRWCGALPELHLPYDGQHPTAFITLCCDKNIAKNPEKFAMDAGIIAQTILLLATEKGLGGLIIGNFVPAKVQAELGLSEEMYPVLVIALGQPTETVKLIDVPADGNTKYFRDAEGVHYVPKRKLEDIVL
jgi:nitroreductase